MQEEVSEPEPADFLNPFQRRIAWNQLHNGVEKDDLCLACQLAMQNGNVRSIGTSDWINNGFRGCDQKAPLSYCFFCRHVIRAREYARCRDLPDPTQEDAYVNRLEPLIFCHDEGMDLDQDTTFPLNLTVEKCQNTRSIRRDLAEIDRIKSWLHDCESYHIDEGCSRHRDGASIAHGHLLLIDVQNDCLVQGNFTDRYFALSYVWGASQQFLTLQNNYQSLLNTGSISIQPITQTIRDSMNFVKNMNEQYLWVDTMVRM